MTYERLTEIRGWAEGTHTNDGWKRYNPVERLGDDNPVWELLDGMSDLRQAIPSLISFALAAPTNEASEQARDAAVERARKLVGLPT